MANSNNNDNNNKKKWKHPPKPKVQTQHLVLMGLLTKRKSSTTMKLPWQSFPCVQSSRAPLLPTRDGNVMAAMPILKVPKDLDCTRILALFFKTS
jgi:hypothetical protein